MPHRLVAEIEQVPGGADRARVLIYRDDRDDVDGSGLDRHHGDVDRRMPERLGGLEVWRDHENPIDPLDAQALHGERDR